MLVPMVELLVGHRAQIDCATDYGESPLGVASFQGRFECRQVPLGCRSRPKSTEVEIDANRRELYGTNIGTSCHHGWHHFRRRISAVVAQNGKEHER